MPWTLRPTAGVGTGGAPVTSYYTLTTSATTGGPTSYKPGQLIILYLRVTAYDYKFRGLLGYARPTSDLNGRVGDWEQPDPELYSSPWPLGNQCQGSLTHTSARIKPFLSKLYWRAPAAGAGSVRFEFLVKQGDANTGAFFYMSNGFLTLTEGTAPPPQAIFLSGASLSCNQHCINIGGSCDQTAQTALATGGLTGMQNNVWPWFACNHMLASCQNIDPLRTAITNDCTYHDAATCGAATPASTCAGTTTDSRFCACKPDPCNPSPCHVGGGNCSVDTSRPLTEDAWICTCNSGFGGRDCSQLQPTCGRTGQPHFPCLNGGTCSVSGGSVVCNCATSYGGAWTGLTCEIPPPCDANPCNAVDSAATCSNIPNGTGFSARCACSSGYSGPTCRVIDGCALRALAGQNCLNGGVCADNPDDSSPTRSSCNCPLGWLPLGRCDQDLDECAFGSNPCLHGNCTNLPGTFSCACDTTWSGTLCDQPDAGFLWCPSGPCGSNGVNCVECPADASCVAADIPSGQASSFKCTCRPGWGGKQCQTLVDFCATNPCRNGASCANTPGNPGTGTCTCLAGFTDASCSTDINECLPTNPCQNGGTCNNSPGTFSCACPSTHTGPLCATVISQAAVWCTPDNPCSAVGSSACHECNSSMIAPCVAADIVSPATTGYHCDCLPGYSGAQCASQAQYCSPNPCLNGGTCNQDGSNPATGTCTCPSGYTGSLCETDVDECAAVPSVCRNGGTCTNFPGTFQCACPSGITGNNCEITGTPTPQWCSPVSPCVNSDGCVECPGDSRCTANDIIPGRTSGYKCLCKYGFTDSRCNTPVDFCASNPCLNNGVCVSDPVSNPTTGYSCACPTGFTGQNCQTNPDDCLGLPANTCQNGGVCVDGVGTFTCNCQPQYSGANCQQYTVGASELPCRSNSDCPSDLDSTCNGAGQYATCGNAIGCADDSSCPSFSKCTGAIGSSRYCQEMTGLADGEPCNANSQCESGNCIDSVCSVPVASAASFSLL